MLDERRPGLILTREPRLHLLTRITVAPITSTVRGLSTEVPVGAGNGLDHESVISRDDLVAVHASAVGASIGPLFDDEEEVQEVRERWRGLRRGRRRRRSSSPPSCAPRRGR